MCINIRALPWAIVLRPFGAIIAKLCHDTYSAHQGVEHDDMNILVLGACVVGLELAKELVRAFVEAKFDGAERHSRRLEKIRILEMRYGHQTTSMKGERVCS